MTVMAADRLGQILQIRELAVLRRIREIRGQLVELARGGRIAVCLGSLRGRFEIRRNLLRHLLILRRVRLLQLLEGAGYLGELRKLPAVPLLRGRRNTGAALGARRIRGEAAGIESSVDNRL